MHPVTLLRVPARWRRCILDLELWDHIVPLEAVAQSTLLQQAKHQDGEDSLENEQKGGVGVEKESSGWISGQSIAN